MTAKTILVKIRIPEYLIKKIDNLQERGIYTSRTEVILDSVRRLVFAYRTDNPLKIA
ncbi:MAG: ribbon-helix-helix protein, CopG family [Methanospirillaceae archaeon]|nr:ribbon-helix-helix protein, CopG family [Methanospirillaceae archaeon]